MPEARMDQTRAGRRDFLRLLSTTAVAGWAAGTVGAAASRDGAADPISAVSLGKYRISRLIAGSNPIHGYSYLGSHTDRQMQEYFTPERTVEFLQDCEQAGITTHQFGYSEHAVDYLRRWRQVESPMQMICLHSGRDGLESAIQSTRPIAVAHHGGVTDRLFAEGKAEQVRDYVKAVHDQGLLAGVSAHNPDCIRRIADAGWEVDFFMTCFYFLTRRVAGKEQPLPTLEIGYPFYREDPQVMTQVIRQVQQPCLAFKILGGGRMCSSQETVRAAFRYAFENIKPTDAVIVGMFPRYFDEVEANTRYTRELCGTSSSAPEPVSG